MPKDILVVIRHKLKGKNKETKKDRKKDMGKEEGWGSKGRTEEKSSGRDGKRHQ